MPLSIFSRILCFVLLASTASHAQSLADVLSSIQERKQTIEQSKQVDVHLRREFVNSQTPIPSQSLIEWEGLGATFPCDSDTASLGMDARITLLNQAIRELRKLQTSYLNFREEDLVAGAKAGALRPYMLEDFPDPGRAGADNYHQVLRLLAQSIRRLSVLEWPVAGLKKVATATPPAEPAPPVSVAPGTVTGEGTWEWSSSTAMFERCHYTSDWGWGGGAKKEDYFFAKIGLFSCVPGRQDQIPGKVGAIFKNSWSSLPAGSLQITAPTSWDPKDGSCQIALAENDPSGEFPMATPQSTLALDFSGYVPLGYAVLPEEAGNFTETSWENLLGVASFPISPGPPNHGYYVMSRRMHALFAPEFTKGLDETGKSARLDQSEKASAAAPGDAVPLLHPSPGMLMGIPLGVGLDGGAVGYIGITPGETDSNLIGYSHQHLGNFMSPPDVNPQPWELAYRFDYAASLRFIGPVEDFHVVYETSRGMGKRGAALPTEIPTELEITNMGCKFFFRNWDLPRLKQVVSRDFIVNITPQGHYKNEVKIYRRPANAGAVDRTPGQAVTDLGGAQLIRTLVLENPDGANDPYPDTPEYLGITDGETAVYKIWRTGYPTSAQKTTGRAGVIHPDLNFEITEGNAVRYANFMNFNGIGNVTTATSVDGVTVSTETINDENWAWFLGMEPSNRTIIRGSQTTAVTSTHADNPSPWLLSYRNEWHPLTSYITITNQPDIDLTWDSSGRLVSKVQGAWRMDYSIEAAALKAESKFSDTAYATTWTEWSGNDLTIKTYTAPDGTVASMTADETDWTQLTLGNASGTGLPGLPHQLTRKDGSGTGWTWAVGGDHSGSLIVQTNTQTQTTAWNNRNYPISSQTSFIANGAVIVSNHAVPSGQFTDWGAPTQWKNLLTNLSSGIAYDGLLNRPASTTSPLGLSTSFANYDLFYSPGQVVSNGITANHTYGALSTTSDFTAADLASGSQTSYSTNVEGTNVTTGLTWGGVGQSQNAVRGASATSITGSHTLLGASSATLRNADGSMTSADDGTIAFGGVTGDALSVVSGLLVTKSAVAGQTNTFAATHTDAWGRTRKVVTPSKSSSGSTQTTYDYSLPANPLKRIITTESSGRILITESDAAGTITRSGIDVNGNGSLDGSDRYNESVTSVVNGKVVTTLTITEEPVPGDTNPMREVMHSELTPATGVTVTTINGGEETITTTPNYGAKTVITESNKGWTRTTALNNLGLAASNTLSGTGISNTELKPVWRSDGSLASVELDIITGPENQKESHTASFKPDGTLDSLTAPGRGNILGEHTVSNGVETLTVNGVTMQASLDGTNQSISGANVIGRSEALTTNGGGYKNATTPAVGAPTDTFFNASLASTGKTYADTSGETYGYSGELLSSITLARGGAVAHGYSNDGAKDLASAVWPEIASGPFTIPSVGIGFAYNRSGNISTLSDPSGTRTLGYQKARLVSTTYTTGILKGYEIIPGRDSVGRHNGTLLKRDDATIHATAKAPNGASDQITNLGSGNLTATPTRDGAGRINGYIWSDGTNTVTQTWTRGSGGRIESAGSDVSGASSFVYLLDPENPEQSFDGSVRRLKCTTAGGTWSYVYGAGGQLTSATHPTLGTFTYAFDGIGRRTDKGEANTTDVLNRTTAWTHSQNKTLTVKAHPDARMWFNGVEIENFSGTHNAAITPPGAEGGWVPWETLAILEGAGDGTGDPPTNPLASPDAKAEKKGAVWVPPTAETLTYDAAGNRESSAQWDFGWDAKNQLARARTKNHNTAAQGYDITYTYDSEGRRIRKHVLEYLNGTQVSEKIITFVWDGWDLFYERHQLPSGLTLLERKYLWGPDIADGSAGGAGGLLLIRETKGNTTKDIIPLYDGGGNVIALADINKNLLASYQFGPFGEKISATGPNANSNPWRWATKYFDEETGLYYFGKRYYDPITGQWLSREILGESESINLYSYCHNDPINKVDVLGLSAFHFFEGGWVREMFEKAVMGKASEYHDYVEGNKSLISAGLGTQSVGPLDILQDGSANLVGSIVGLANDAGTQAAYAQSAHRNDGGGDMASLGYGISQFIGTLSGAQMIAQGDDGRAMSWMPDGNLQVANLSSDESQQYMTFGTLQLVGNASMFSYLGKSAYRFKTEGLIMKSAPSSGAVVIGKSGTPRASISGTGRGIGGHQVVDGIAGEAQGALSYANKVLTAGGTGGTRWGQIYQNVSGSGRWFENLARRNALHSISEAKMLNNRYVIEAIDRGFIVQFNRGSLIGMKSSRGALLRPDIQIRTPSGRFGIIDWTTQQSASKIFKYGDATNAPWMINVVVP